MYAGYYDTHHSGHKQPKPSPWKGSSQVVFVGKPDNSSGGWDTSAIRVDNLTGDDLSVTVTVDLAGATTGIYYASLVTRTGTVRGRFVLVK